MKLFSGGGTVAEHPDKERSVGSDIVMLHFRLVPAVECLMVLCGG